MKKKRGSGETNLKQIFDQVEQCRNGVNNNFIKGGTQPSTPQHTCEKQALQSIVKFDYSLQNYPKKKKHKSIKNAQKYMHNSQ